MERVEYRSRGLCALCSDEHLQGLSGTNGIGPTVTIPDFVNLSR